MQMQTPHSHTHTHTHTHIKLQIRLEIVLFSNLEHFNAMALINISLWCVNFVMLWQYTFQNQIFIW